MSRQNYYILLDLDPAERDPARILAKIEAKRAEWSRHAQHPTKGPQNTANLKMIPDMRVVMENLESRENEAQEAARICREERRQATSKLDEAIGVLAAKGHLWKPELETLVNSFRGEFTEDEIRERVTVPVKDQGTRPAPKAKLDPSLAKIIQDNLEFLGKADLYEFLGFARSRERETLILTQLLERADSIYREALNNNNKTAEVDASQRLAGEALQLFKDEAGRKKYDNTLEWQRLRELDPTIEAAGSDGRLESEEVEQLLRLAREKKLGLDETMQYILDYARPRNWAVEVPKLSESKAAKLAQCGNCGVLNEDQARVCCGCGSPLRIECPRCKQQTPTEHQVCLQCGFRTGDVWTVRRLVGDADRALARGATNEAAQLLAEAELLWPDCEEVRTRLAQVLQRQQEEHHLTEQLHTALAARRLASAERLLASCRKRGLPDAAAEALEARIRTGLDAAKRLVDRARALERSGRSDDAVDAYSDALRECQDYRDALEGMARCPPEPPRKLKATPTVHVVALNWIPSPSRGELRYRVVRKAGSQPQGVGDGQIIAETATLSLTDDGATPGELYYYAVYALRGGATSHLAAICGPVLQVAEVGDLAATARDRAISLTWTPPGRVRAIEVWRSAGGAPRKRTEGTRLTTVTLTSATDRALTNGTFYGYRIVAVFDGPDAKPVYSDGITVSAAPAAPPQPVTDLNVIRQGLQFEVSWTPPPIGQVQIFVADRAPAAKCGDLLAASSLSNLGKAISLAGPAKATGALEGREVRFLIPVTVAGSTIVLGQYQTVTWIDDVEDLEVAMDGGIITVRWKWPAGIDTVLVAVRADRFPADPQDSRAICQKFGRFMYDRDGGYRRQIPKVQRLFLTVYAAAQTAGRWHYASGATPGCRKEVALSCCRTLKYGVRSKRRFPKFGRTEHTLTIFPDAAMRLPELVLVIKSGGLPLHPGNGSAVLRIKAGTPCSPEQPLVVGFQPPVSAGKWKARLFPANDSDGQWLNLEAKN